MSGIGSAFGSLAGGPATALMSGLALLLHKNASDKAIATAKQGVDTGRQNLTYQQDLARQLFDLAKGGSDTMLNEARTGGDQALDFAKRNAAEARQVAEGRKLADRTTASGTRVYFDDKTNSFKTDLSPIDQFNTDLKNKRYASSQDEFDQAMAGLKYDRPKSEHDIYTEIAGLARGAYGEGNALEKKLGDRLLARQHGKMGVTTSRGSGAGAGDELAQILLQARQTAAQEYQGREAAVRNKYLPRIQAVAPYMNDPTNTSVNQYDTMDAQRSDIAKMILAAIQNEGQQVGGVMDKNNQLIQNALARGQTNQLDALKSGGAGVGGAYNSIIGALGGVATQQGNQFKLSDLASLIRANATAMRGTGAGTKATGSGDGTMPSTESFSGIGTGSGSTSGYPPLPQPRPTSFSYSAPSSGVPFSTGPTAYKGPLAPIGAEDLSDPYAYPTVGLM